MVWFPVSELPTLLGWREVDECLNQDPSCPGTGVPAVIKVVLWKVIRGKLMKMWSQEVGKRSSRALCHLESVTGRIGTSTPQQKYP